MIDAYDEALEIDGKYAGAWNNKGLALGSLGKDHESVECYDKVLKIDGYYGEAYYNRARSKCRLDKVNECLDDSQAIELDERYIDLAKKDEQFATV